jgi:hypothetical protein
VTDVEARDLIKVICRAMHGPDKEYLAFAPMPLHIVFEKLIGFKPHELLFMKTSAAITQKESDSKRIRVRVQGPDIDGTMFEMYCEKERDRTLAQVFDGVEVIDCVIIEVDLQYFSVGIGNRKWMMAMHEIAKPQLRSQVLPNLRQPLVAPKVPKDPADTVVRSRLSSLSWFKNISINDAKQVRQRRIETVLLALLDAVIRAGCQITWHQPIYRLSGCFGKERFRIPPGMHLIVGFPAVSPYFTIRVFLSWSCRSVLHRRSEGGLDFKHQVCCVTLTRYFCSGTPLNPAPLELLFALVAIPIFRILMN